MKGMIFATDSVRAIMEDRKTQTRRLSGLKEINENPSRWEPLKWQSLHTKNFSKGVVLFEKEDGFHKVINPRYQVGEVVYVREAWRPYGEKEVRIEYKADGAIIEYPERPIFSFYGCGSSWRSFLPAWAARFFRQITAVRPERLQEISWADCLAEGVLDAGNDNFYLPQTPTLLYSVPQGAYRQLWDSLNSKHPWSDNDWVWVYSFKKVEKP